MKCFMVIDYNNTRFRDVSYLRMLVAEKYDLKLVLVRPEANALDSDLCDFLFKISLSDHPKKIAERIKSDGLEIVGGFVFSDRAMVFGNELLAHLNLPFADAEYAKRALCKVAYRGAEQECLDCAPVRFWSPKIELFTSRKEFDAAVLGVSYPFVSKPAKEGNNRGVMIVSDSSQLDQAWELVAPFASQGGMIEEWIPIKQEYSFDGVGSRTFITKKYTSKGKFPVEIGQQVPAILDSDSAEMISAAGEFANQLVAANGVGFHNEIKLDHPSGLVAVVEPNRRPAGMHIWELARKVYDFDFFEELVRSCLGKVDRSAPTQPLRAKGIASIRMLPASQDGPWRFTKNTAKALLEKCITPKPEIEILFSEILKAEGDPVTANPAHNGEFVASVACYSESQSESEIQAYLDLIEENWRRATYV